MIFPIFPIDCKLKPLRTIQARSNQRQIYRCRSFVHRRSTDTLTYANDRRYSAFKITDGNGNSLELSTQVYSAYGHFVQGKDHLANLPTNYRYYSIVLQKDVIVTPADIDAIPKWQDAQQIKISDNADVA